MFCTMRKCLSIINSLLSKLLKDNLDMKLEQKIIWLKEGIVPAEFTLSPLHSFLGMGNFTHIDTIGIIPSLDQAR